MPVLLADDKIPGAREAFGFGGRLQVRAVPAEAIDRALILAADAEFLVVRSTVKIDDALVAGTRLGFVGTATVGVDHIDEQALQTRGLTFASAAGSSAGSVAQFTIATAHLALAATGRSLEGATLAVVGAGAIGERVASTAEALGARVIRHDPPRAAVEANSRCTSDRALLASADVVSIHVPLTHGGAHPTEGLVDRAFLDELATEAILINTSRGDIVEESALLAEAPRPLVLDVFRGEPRPDPRVLQRCRLCSPHVAGRSLEGMLANTAHIARAIARHLDGPGADCSWRPSLPEPPTITMPRDDALAFIRTAWSLEEDTRVLKDAPSSFSNLRHRVPLRRDLSAWRDRSAWAPDLQRFLDALPTNPDLA
ncbi:MAG: 4-phosphoerythronate dehydrogenase [Planctomycetes bacterium]|nr:4-phosphoerythronate dehydrogenase [Planctomycetota bacterium]